MTRARNLFIGGLTAAGPSYKCWAVRPARIQSTTRLVLCDHYRFLALMCPVVCAWQVLQGNAFTLYEERVRGEKRVKTVLTLNGAICKAPPSSKKQAALARKALGAGLEGGGVLHLEPTNAAAAGARISVDGGKKAKGKGDGKKEQPQVGRA